MQSKIQKIAFNYVTRRFKTEERREKVFLIILNLVSFFTQLFILVALSIFWGILFKVSILIIAFLLTRKFSNFESLHDEQCFKLTMIFFISVIIFIKVSEISNFEIALLGFTFGMMFVDLTKKVSKKNIDGFYFNKDEKNYFKQKMFAYYKNDLKAKENEAVEMTFVYFKHDNELINQIAEDKFRFNMRTVKIASKYHYQNKQIENHLNSFLNQLHKEYLRKNIS